MFDISDTTNDLVKTTDTTASSASAEEAIRQGCTQQTATADLPKEQPDESQGPCTYNKPEPSGLAVFDSADREAFEKLATELKLSPQQVEKLADFESAREKRKTEETLVKKHQQSVSWANQTRALYGAGLEQEITFALRAANTFGGPELRALLEETGLGNHPVIIRTLSGIGRTISEDACPGGTPAAPKDKTFAEALYGK